MERLEVYMEWIYNNSEQINNKKSYYAQSRDIFRRRYLYKWKFLLLL